MILRSLWLVAMAAFFASIATAQCPRTTTKTIDGSLQAVGTRGCGGIDFTVNGMTISTNGDDGCPLFIREVPKHEEVVKAKTETKTMSTNAVSSWSHFFNCSTEWYVIVPWGSVCNHSSSVATATLYRRVTVPC